MTKTDATEGQTPSTDVSLSGMHKIVPRPKPMAKSPAIQKLPETF